MSLRRQAARLLVAALAAVLLPAALSAQEITAARVDKGPVLDGILDDACWSRAAAFTDFRQQNPVPNGAPSEKTELRVVYDATDLYIGILCLDREPARIAATSMAHDAFEEEFGVQDDVVRVLLDPFQDRRNAYLFMTNANGARSEGLAQGEHTSLDWDGIWDAAGRVFDGGWSVEIRLPFKTISFRRDLAEWGLNVERFIARRQETIRFSHPQLDAFFGSPINAGVLRGIGGVRQGLGVTFRPYGLAGVERDRELGVPSRGRADAGFDLYKNFTPNFVGALTYNTDFAETEVDERRINLTRFPLYFPEKRTFFLEGSDIFSFGGTDSESFVPFFSRRIGLVQGRQVPVAFGGKVYGKLGRTNIALLDMSTRRFDELALPGQNFFAGRVSQNVLEESKVGMIFTDGDPSGRGRNSLLGFDASFQTSRFLGDKNLNAGLWWVRNWNTVPGGNHDGYGIRLDYPNDLVDTVAIYNVYGDALDPGLGFIARPGVKTFFGGFTFSPRPEKGWIGRQVRKAFFQFYPTFYWDLGGRLETREFEIVPFRVETERGDQFQFQLNPKRDILPYDFEVADGVVIPKGGYDFTEWQVEYSSPSYKPVYVNAEYGAGGFYSGTIRNVELGVNVRLGGHLDLGLDTNLVRGRLPQGDFRENVYQLKADFYLTPNLGLLNYIQYDDVSRSLGANVRFRWRVAPGNEIFLVYNSTWERRWDPVSRFVPLASHGVFKVTLSIRP